MVRLVLWLSIGRKPACGVPVESKIVDTTTAFAACDFTQLAAHLQVTPADAFQLVVPKQATFLG